MEEISLQNKPKPDGFLLHHPYKRPITWALREWVPGEIAHVCDKLSAQHITPKVGTEIEFSFDERYAPKNGHWQEKRKEIFEHIQQQIQITSDFTEKLKLCRRFEEAGTFTAEQVLMYDILYLDPLTRDLAKRNFGKRDETQPGFYDAEGVLEIQLHPTDPLQACDHYAAIVGTIYKKTEEYGLRLRYEPCQHVSFSFEKDGRNLFDGNHPQAATLGKKIVEGMGRVFSDFIVTLYDRDGKHDRRLPKTMELALHRKTYLRMANQRVEVRSHASAELRDTPFMILLGLVGAAYGLSPQDKDYFNEAVIPAKPVQRAWCKRSLTHGMCTHVINGSELRNGKLVLPVRYITNNISYLARELGIVNEDTAHLLEANAYKANLIGNLAERIIDWFAGIRIDKQVIHFPTGLTKFLSENEAVDMKNIAKGIQVGGIENTFTISPGYIPATKLTDINQAKNSVPMEEVCSPEFFQALRGMLDQQLRTGYRGQVALSRA